MEKQEALYWRDALRSARDNALGNSEGFLPIVQCVERMGNRLAGKPTVRLSKALDKIGKKVIGSRGGRAHPLLPGFETLKTLICQARNDAVHVGATARALTSNAVRLSLMIEDGVMKRHETNIADCTTRHPVCAEEWQPVELVRQTMMERQFAYLPIRICGKWQVLTAVDVARFLSVEEKKRLARLCLSVRDALRDTPGLVPRRAHVTVAEENATCALRKASDEPILVVKRVGGEDRLLGIVTAFDLL